MKTIKYYGQIKAITITTSILSLLWLYWTIGRSIFTLTDVQPNGFSLLQFGICFCYSLFAVAMITTQITFLMKQMKSIKNGILFDRSCAKYLTIWGVLWFFYDICSSNIANIIYNGTMEEFVIDGTAFGIPVIALTFAILYRMAAEVSEENNLTI